MSLSRSNRFYNSGSFDPNTDNPTNFIMATAFPLFPLLPKELRLSIWNLALQPRIVELCFNFPDEGNGNEDQDQDQYEERENEERDQLVVETDNGVKNGDEDQAEENGDVKDNSPCVTNNTGDFDIKDEDQQHEAGSPDINSNRDAVNDDDDDEDNNSDASAIQALKTGQFYSPTPLPSLLCVNSEARSVALGTALKGFPLASNREDVYYNPEIDILYFPAWCWQEDVMGFEQLVSEEVKGRIRRVALENLMWMSYWEEGTVNGQITIEQLKGLKEFIFAMRELTQCGCCISFDGPERGHVEFAEIETEHEIEEADETMVVVVAEKVGENADADNEAEINKSNDELRKRREREALGLEVDEEVKETIVEKRKKGGKFDYTKRYLARLEEEFLKIKEADPDWNVPKARFVRLKRDGEFAGDP